MINLVIRTFQDSQKICVDALSSVRKELGFDIDINIICNALKKRLKITEVPISYKPRSYHAGKKIRWVDGLWAIFYIFKYRFN